MQRGRFDRHSCQCVFGDGREGDGKRERERWKDRERKSWIGGAWTRRRRTRRGRQIDREREKKGGLKKEVRGHFSAKALRFILMMKLNNG